MRESSRPSVKKESNIPCIEVLISRDYIRDNGGNLFWMLSVYSLENQPVSRNRALHNSEIFHFMVFDWKRTIKKMLEDQQVPYSIVQYFSAESIHSDALQEAIGIHDKEEDFLSAISNLSELNEGKVEAAHEELMLGHRP